jgi:hypothetical protein
VGAATVTARGINNQRQIVGDYTHANFVTHGFLLNLSAPFVWKAAADGDFNTGSNWSTGTVPGASDDAVITAAGT